MNRVGGSRCPICREHTHYLLGHIIAVHPREYDRWITIR